MPTRWFNPSVPQTLQISQFLLYIDAFFALVALLAGPGASMEATLQGQLVAVASVAAYAYGGWGIANEKRTGYRVAVVASFLPLAGRVLNTLGAGGPLTNLGFVFLGQGIIAALFEYALIGLLLHAQSREYQRIWFH